MPGRQRARASAGAAWSGASGAGFRATIGLALAAGFCLVLWTRLDRLDLSQVLARVQDLPLSAWALALVFTAVSYSAVAGHDLTLHRHLRTGVAPGAARRAGFAAIAVSQLAGAGLLTGTLIRWRMLPTLGLGAAARLTAMVSVAFLAGWAVSTAAAFAVFGSGTWRLAGLGAGVVLLAAGAMVWRHLGVRHGVSARLMMRVPALAAVDCAFAALAFWALAPEGLLLADCLPVVILAIGLSLATGAPAGLGSFELLVLAMIPAMGAKATGSDALGPGALGPDALGAEALLATVLAWRAVYFGLPALLGAGLALIGPTARARRTVPGMVPATPPLRPAFAEAGLLRQGQLAALRADSLSQPGAGTGPVWAGARLAATLVLLRGPLTRVRNLRGAAGLGALHRAARAEGRGVAIYKADARLAAKARKAGWRAFGVAREAVLRPGAFRLDASACAGLRRKLRRAAEAGVIARSEAADPAELARLNAEWVAARGAEMGFSMGRHEPGYLSGQRLYVARVGLRPVGFASFHTSADEWALDLLRPSPRAPDGTAQALVAAALADAARAGLPRLSLAAVPEAAFAERRKGAGRAFARPALRLTARMLRPMDWAGTGLLQFKSAFAPRWERLYLLAPGLADLALAGLDLRRAIAHPGPLPQALPDAHPEAPSEAPADPAQNAIASPPAPWHRMAS